MGGQSEEAYSPLESESKPESEVAVCLVSGGMDSCVTASIAGTNHAQLAFLHASYGQLTEERERRAFEEIADHFKVDRRLVISLKHLGEIGGSSLTDSSMAVTVADLKHQGIPTSYVPFRNAHLLAIATSWAEVINAGSIYIGAVAEDSSGYPDCRPEFYEAFQEVVNVGTKPETNIEIKTPIISLRKSEIVKLGLQLNAPLELTWSCYKSSDRACGECDSCALRLRAFRQAEHTDPIPYVLDSSRFAY